MLPVLALAGVQSHGLEVIECLQWLQDEAQRQGIIMCGEIGGSAEEEAAEFIAEQVTEPVVGFIAGARAPKGKRMGHAGAIDSGGAGTGEGKFAALETDGVTMVPSQGELGA